MRVVKILGGTALGLIAASLQGVAVFWLRGYDGTLLNRTGLECALIPAAVEIVVFVVVMKNLDSVHASAISNPHSLLGQALRNGTAHAPAPRAVQRSLLKAIENIDFRPPRAAAKRS